MGMNTSMPGQEGIPSVFSPMARTLGDLVYFSKSIISMKPWNYDHSVHPIEWRESQEREAKEKMKFKVGVLRTDGMNSTSLEAPSDLLFPDEAQESLILPLHVLVP